MQGFQAPHVRQFSVFLENRVGRLLDLLRHFDDAADVHVVGLNVIDSSDHAVVRMITDDADAARVMLGDFDIAFSESEVVIAALDDDRSLADACLYLLGAELNIHFIYALFRTSIEGHNLVAIATDDLTLGSQVLTRKGFTLLGEADLR